jgi:hypothetical protein
MSYIFLDESGDLGFNFKKQKTSRFFIITFLFIPRDKRPIEKVVRKTLAELKKRHKRRIGVLHAYQEKPVTRQRLLQRLAEQDCSCMAIYLNRKRVYTKLQNEKIVLYNYITNILLDRIFTKGMVSTNKPIHLIASRRETNRFFNENFRTYLHNQISGNHKAKIDVKIATPAKEKALQAVDFMSWSLFRKYEHNDESYYQIIKDIIIEESHLFA